MQEHVFACALACACAMIQPQEVAQAFRHASIQMWTGACVLTCMLTYLRLRYTARGAPSYISSRRCSCTLLEETSSEGLHPEWKAGAAKLEAHLLARSRRHYGWMQRATWRMVEIGQEPSDRDFADQSAQVSKRSEVSRHGINRS